MSNLSEFVGGPSFPVPVAQPWDATTHQFPYDSYVTPGPNGNGDWFQIPISKTNNLVYNDESSIPQWTKTAANFDAAAGATLTDYCGFLRVNNTFYVLGVDTVPALDTFYLMTVADDVSGTITLVGSDVMPTTNFNTSPDFHNGGNAAGNSQLFSVDGTNLRLIVNQNSNEVRSINLDISSGLTITDPTLLLTTNVSSHGIGIPVSGTQHITTIAGTGTTSVILTERDSYRTFITPSSSEMPLGTLCYEWDGFIEYRSTLNSTRYLQSDLLNWFNEISSKFNITWEFS